MNKGIHILAWFLLGWILLNSFLMKRVTDIIACLKGKQARIEQEFCSLEFGTHRQTDKQTRLGSVLVDICSCSVPFIEHLVNQLTGKRVYGGEGASEQAYFSVHLSLKLNLIPIKTYIFIYFKV